MLQKAKSGCPCQIFSFLMLTSMAWTTMDKLQLTKRNLGRVFNSRSGCVHVMKLHCFEAKVSNLKLKTQTRQLLGCSVRSLEPTHIGLQIEGRLIILNAGQTKKLTFTVTKNVARIFSSKSTSLNTNLTTKT